MAEYRAELDECLFVVISPLTEEDHREWDAYMSIKDSAQYNEVLCVHFPVETGEGA